MKPKIKEMNKLVKFIVASSVSAITLAPFGIYIREKNMNNARTKNHESIHWCQQIEMLIIFFYLWYIIEWFLRIFINRGNAYRNLSHEREAYANDDNINYISVRKPYSWLKYLSKN